MTFTPLFEILQHAVLSLWVRWSILSARKRAAMVFHPPFHRLKWLVWSFQCGFLVGSAVTWQGLPASFIFFQGLDERWFAGSINAFKGKKIFHLPFYCPMVVTQFDFNEFTGVVTDFGWSPWFLPCICIWPQWYLGSFAHYLRSEFYPVGWVVICIFSTLFKFHLFEWSNLLKLMDTMSPSTIPCGQTTPIPPQHHLRGFVCLPVRYALWWWWTDSPH